MLHHISEIEKLAERAAERIRHLEEENRRLQGEVDQQKKNAEDRELELMMLREEQEKTQETLEATREETKREHTESEERLAKLVETFRGIAFQGSPE